MVLVGLFVILAIILIAPFSVKKIEEELEISLFVIGCVAVTITSQWSMPLIVEGLSEPVKIALAVFIAGVVFNAISKPIAGNINRIADTFGLKLFVFLLVVGLGFLSSIITAIIASLVLVEIITCLSLERKEEIRLVVLACFSVGLGASLTPVGEPLSTITIAKLKGPPYQAGFFFLVRHLGLFIAFGVLLLGILAAILIPNKRKPRGVFEPDKKETFLNIALRAIKVYLFVMALVFLGKGFKPIIDIYISKIPYFGIYWLNITSAFLDNATLAAAEIGPGMSILQIKSALLGLLIAGGMLIPGNIPNIIAAGKLKIKSSEWAAFGVPLGLLIMTAGFFCLLLTR